MDAISAAGSSPSHTRKRADVDAPGEEAAAGMVVLSPKKQRNAAPSPSSLTTGGGGGGAAAAAASASASASTTAESAMPPSSSSSTTKSHAHHTAARPAGAANSSQRQRPRGPPLMLSAAVAATSSSSSSSSSSPAPDLRSALAAARAEAVGPERRERVQAASSDPEFYKNACGYSAEENHDLEDIYAAWDGLVPEEDEPLIEDYCRGLAARDCRTARDVERAMADLRRTFKDRRRPADGSPYDVPKKSAISHVYNRMAARGEVPSPHPVQRLLVKKAAKSLSGVLVITVLTSPYPTVYPEDYPESDDDDDDDDDKDDGAGKAATTQAPVTQRFSCEWDCHYCPNEPGQPRSYLHDEPSVLRANRNDFDAVRQFTDRAVTLAINGHPVDKIELLVLGGTWASYPVKYQEQFCRDLFYAANTFFERPRDKRPKMSLRREKAANEEARVKIIGLTLETRPDCIDLPELRRMRRYGCTRVQLGMQHTDDGVLRKINRGATRADMVRAIELLKDCCYKLDLHIMPNLPGSDAAMDAAMFDEVLFDEWLQADQWKIYPCEITPWTKIKQWFEAGEYVPYADEELAELLLQVLPRIHPWVRVNRVVRDIPSQYILAGMDRPNLRQDLDGVLRGRGIRCQDIRAREVQGQQLLTGSAALVVRRYDGSGADEYFLSFETPDRQTIFGFARLRIGGAAGGLDYADEPGDDDGQGGVLRRLRRRKGRRRREEAERRESGTDGSFAEEQRRKANRGGGGAAGGGGRGGRAWRWSWRGVGDWWRRVVYGTRCRESAFFHSTLRPSSSSSSSSSSLASLSSSSLRQQGPHRRRRMTCDPKLEPIFPELVGCSLVRELHVYGQLESVDIGGGGGGGSGGGSGGGGRSEQQHVGFGTQLMREAERLSARAGYGKVAVIAGVGVRSYYRSRLGYSPAPGPGEFLIKRLPLAFRLRHHRFLGGAVSAAVGTVWEAIWGALLTAAAAAAAVAVVVAVAVLRRCGFLRPSGHPSSDHASSDHASSAPASARLLKPLVRLLRCQPRIMRATRRLLPRNLPHGLSSQLNESNNGDRGGGGGTGIGGKLSRRQRKEQQRQRKQQGQREAGDSSGSGAPRAAVSRSYVLMVAAFIFSWFLGWGVTFILSRPALRSSSSAAGGAAGWW